MAGRGRGYTQTRAGRSSRERGQIDQWAQSAPEDESWRSWKNCRPISQRQKTWAAPFPIPRFFWGRIDRWTSLAVWAISRGGGLGGDLGRSTRQGAPPLGHTCGRRLHRSFRSWLKLILLVHSVACPHSLALHAGDRQKTEETCELG